METLSELVSFVKLVKRPFSTNVPLDVFRGYRSGTWVENGLMLMNSA